MFRKPMLLFVLISFMLFATQCSKNNSTEPDNSQNDQVLMPLGISNAWSYKYFQLDSTGTDTLDVSNFTLTIQNKTTINDQEYYLFADGTVARNTTTGLIMGYYDQNTNKISDDEFFKYPVNDGETYTYTTIDGQSTIHYKVTKTTLQVAAGKFDECYAYQILDVPFESIIYFAPGVGLIRTKNVDAPGENIELLSYSITK